MTLDLVVTHFRPTKARPASSLDSIAEVLRRAKEGDPPADLVLLPEAALTGYELQGGVQEHAWTAAGLFDALASLHAELPGPERPMDVAVGFYERHRHRVYNAALYAELGGASPGIRHVHRKVFLPTYGLFDERRFLQPGSEIRAFDTRWGRAALLVCEDLFHGISSALAAMDGAEVLLVPAAAPARGPGGPGRPASSERWERVIRATAEEHGVFVAVSQHVGSDAGRALAGGATVVGPGGEILAELPLWEEGQTRVRVDLEEMDLARARAPLLGDLEEALPRLLENSPGAPGDGGGGRNPDVPEPGRSSRAQGEKPSEGQRTGRRSDGWPSAAHEPDPEDRSPLAIDPALVERWLVDFLREEVREKRGFESVVVGISGGVDSGVTAALCARALGPERVEALFLPSRTTSEESLRHAREVADASGLELRRVELAAAVDAVVEAADLDMDPRRRGNVAARLRMITLFDRAKARGALPVGTGNKSERLLGYFTWHGDDAPPVNPLGDLYKSQVWTLARHLGLPDEVVEKAPSAELEAEQTDEGDLGVTYRDADLILYWLLRGETAEDLVGYGFSEPAVRTVHELLHGTHWKRHLPTVAILTDAAIGDSYLRPVDYR